jgi:transcriptional regulator with XRE-family HTH domain
MSVFGDFVKLRREELNLDQTELAQSLGVHQQTVSKWEQAKTVPKPQRIRRLAEILRVEVADLMRYAGYLPDGEPPARNSGDQLQQLMNHVATLTDDQLIVLIDHAWEAYRDRVGFSLEGPRRRKAKKR